MPADETIPWLHKVADYVKGAAKSQKVISDPKASPEAKKTEQEAASKRLAERASGLPDMKKKYGLDD